MSDRFDGIPCEGNLFLTVIALSSQGKRRNISMYTFCDEEFGEVRLRADSRACRMIFRVKEGVLYVTVPRGYAWPQIANAMAENREQLRLLFARYEATREKRRLSIGDRIPCYGGDICLLPGIDSMRFLFRYQGDCLQVFCPQQADLNEPDVHKILSRGICRFVYRRAQSLLPRRFVQVSERLGISPVPLSVGRGRRKLGHCTLNGEIQLSFYLMFLPEELIDYVICHELAHLRYMDHGPQFHALCNRYCGGKELLLRKKLRSFPFLIS